MVLKDLARAFHVPLDRTAPLTGPILVIGLGAFGAMGVTALGDRIGRRPLLIGTTLIYALFTGLTALAGNLATFVVFQFLARTFLIAEYATAITIVAEEFPAQRRGRALGALGALGAFGLPVVAVLHLVFSKTALGYRALYLVGIVPLLIVAALRVKLRETARWEHLRAEGKTPPRLSPRFVASVVDRKLMAKVCAVYFFVHFAQLGAATWWPYYAQVQRHFSDHDVTMILAGSYPLGVLGSLAAGRLEDRFGRRRTGVTFVLLGLVFTFLVFRVTRPGPMFPALAAAVFFGLGTTPILNAIASELFPTEVRASAVAFARSIFGTLGAISGPFLIGLAADPGLARKFPGLGSLRNLPSAISVATLMYLPAAFLLLRLPESAGKELEAIAPDPV